MLPPRLKIALKSLIARYLIKYKRLKFSAYQLHELQPLLDEAMPQSFDLSVPKGEGKLVLMQAELSMPKQSNLAEVSLLCGLDISSMGNLLYRAHITLNLTLLPGYDMSQKRLFSQQTKVTGIHLVHDEYSILNDTRSLIQSFFPGAVTMLLADGMKSALSMLTAGTTDAALNYFRLYLDGNKQRILDYHHEQIEHLIQQHTAPDTLFYELNPDDWEEKLFIDLGQSVAVEEGELRFKF